MTKEMKTAEQLAGMIEARIGVRNLLISVRKDHAYGWHPTIVSAPGNSLGFQRRVEEIARNLQVQYELRD
jgi:hypothetical protein